MRILFLCQYFPPEPGAPAARVHEHAREWARLGHEVTVVCGLPHYPAGVVAPEYRGRLLAEERVDGVRVLRCWLYATPNRGVLRRSLSFATFLASATLAALFRGGRADVVCATSPQLLCGLAGWLAAALRRRPFVFEVRDLWPQQIVDLGVITHPLVIGPLRALEGFLYRRARAVVTVAPATTEELAGRGVPREKLHTIPNGIDLEFFRPGPRENAVRREHCGGADFVALYIGAHGLSQGLEVVVDAAERLCARRDIRFVLAGDGARRDAVAALAREKGLENITFLPAQPKALMPEFYAAADVCLVPLLRRGVFLTNIPSKMFEIMACARPMILGALGQARALMEEAGAGVAVPPEDGAALAGAVAALADDPDRRAALGAAGRRHAERCCNRSDRAAEYAEVLRAAAARGGAENT